MLSTSKAFALLSCAVALSADGQSIESMLVGEWNCPSIKPEARVVYRADHTYVAWIHNRTFNSDGMGVWRGQGEQIICRDEHGESVGFILKITADEFEMRAPDGLTRTYVRIR